MDRKINIIDFETGKSVSITVDEEDIIDTLLNKVRNYWLKEGDYVLARSGEMLAPVCLVKDYEIMDEEILQLRARSSLEIREMKTLEPSRPEGIIFPKSCPNCGPVEFRYVSATEFQCRNCGGMLQKRPNYKSPDMLDSFLPAGESFMGEISPENPPQEAEVAYDEPASAMDYLGWENTVSYAEENTFTPPPRIVSSEENEPENEEKSLATVRHSRPPRIVGPPDENEMKGSQSLVLQPEDLQPEDNQKIPVLVPEPSTSKIPACEDCGEAMRFIRLYAMWWCDRCERYQGEEDETEEDEENNTDTKAGAIVDKDDKEGKDNNDDNDSAFKLRITPISFHPAKDTQIKDANEENNSLKTDSTTNVVGEKKDFKLNDDHNSKRQKKIEDGLPAHESEKGISNEENEELIELSAIPLVEDEDDEFLIHRGREWLIEFMKMSNPIKTRTRWVNDMLKIEFRDDMDRLCILEIDRSGEEIKPQFYRSSSYRKGGFTGNTEDLF